MSWVYEFSHNTRFGGERWRVGFYKPDHSFEVESEYNNASDAAARVRHLNGGN